MLQPRLAVDVQTAPLELNLDSDLVFTILKALQTWKRPPPRAPVSAENWYLAEPDNVLPGGAEDSSTQEESDEDTRAAYTITPFSYYVIVNQTHCFLRYGQHKSEESLPLPPYARAAYAWHSAILPQVPHPDEGYTYILCSGWCSGLMVRRRGLLRSI